MILRARVVLPVSQPPIDNGAVVVAGSRILSVGRYSALSAQERSNVVDLGESILLPGLINAHCHLDYTGFAGRIPPLKLPSCSLNTTDSTLGSLTPESMFANCRRAASWSA